MASHEAPPRILIVEDDQRLAELTQEYLIRNGLEVSIEGDGQRAIRRIVDEQPDLVVLDIMLPGADGLTVCREVRSQYHQPIIMLTARTDDMDQVLGLEMGADDYVPKPVQPRVHRNRLCRPIFPEDQHVCSHCIWRASLFHINTDIPHSGIYSCFYAHVE